MTNLEWLKGVIAMTNFEWLKNLPTEELKKELLTVYNKDWLNAEHVSKIKPCPVCKGEMSTIWQHGGYYLVCKECGLRFGLDTDMAGRGLIEGDYAEEEALIDDWNRRVHNADEQKHKEEIKPCPCGGKPFVNKDSVHYWVSCSCGVHGTFGTTREQAIEAWNMRVNNGKVDGD